MKTACKNCQSQHTVTKGTEVLWCGSCETVDMAIRREVLSKVREEIEKQIATTEDKEVNGWFIGYRKGISDALAVIDRYMKEE